MVLSPSQLILLTLAVGAVLLLCNVRRAGGWLAGAGLAGLLLFGLLPGAEYLARPLQERFPQPQAPSQVTGIVLLTGAELTDVSEAVGLPQLGAHGDRYVATLRLAERHPDARVIVSGSPIGVGGAPVLASQAGIARTILLDAGLDPARLTVEQQSSDTCENAANVRTLVQPRSGEAWVVVTSAMHMPRTVACLRAAGWSDAIPWPDDYESLPGLGGAFTARIISRLNLLDLAMHEWLGLAYYRAGGRTAEFFPAP
jgi:uncharacterized SAM-binding protein YcdF (DUF218 family)